MINFVLAKFCDLFILILGSFWVFEKRGVVEKYLIILYIKRIEIMYDNITSVFVGLLLCNSNITYLDVKLI